MEKRNRENIFVPFFAFFTKENIFFKKNILYLCPQINFAKKKHTMSEELLQRDLQKNPPKVGKWDFYNIGATSIKSLKENNIIRNVDYGSEEKKKVDALLVQRKNVIAVVEYKKPSEFKTAEQKNKAIKQEIDVARKINANIFIATDTKESIWVNVATGNRIKDEDGKELKINFNPKDEKLPDLIEKIIASINEKNDQIKPKKLINPTDLAKQIWQDIWVVSGESPTNSLYTFIELFIFKYLSDLDVLKGNYNFYNLFESYKTNQNNEVLETYANNIRPQIKKLFPQNPVDKTTIINGSVFVSEEGLPDIRYSGVFKNVLVKFKDYGKLENIDYDFKSKLFEVFLKEDKKSKNLGQFFTPLKVVRAIVAMAKDEIKEGIKICDPACGVGKFLLEPIKTKLDDFYEVKNNKIIPKITIAGFDKGFEGSGEEQKTIILAKANMMIYFSDLIRQNPNITTEFSNLFNESFLLKTDSILGTLSEPTINEYDLILTNPPYVVGGVKNLKEEITKNKNKKDDNLSTHYNFYGLGIESLFIEWIIKALKPFGKAFIIVPNGMLSRSQDAKLRQFIQNECFVDGIISLPKKTFFTTQQKTYILCLTKKSKNTEIQKTPVFSYLVSEIGECRDVNRFDIDQDDLSEAVQLFNGFKGSKEYFSKTNTDIRCKTISASELFTDKKWIIENWWNKEDLIELGLSEEEQIVDIKDYPSLLDELTDNISNIQKEISNISEAKESDFITKNISEIFDLNIKTNNSKFTKTFINTHKGNIPVYSASKFPDNVDYGYVQDNLPDVKYFEDCLTWNIDGSVGKVYYRKGRFSLSEKVIPLILKKEFESNLDIEFLKYAIETEFAKYSFSRENKAGKGAIKDIEIEIPILKTGKFDIELQRDIAKKYKFIDKMKEDLKNQMNNLLNIQIKL
jgi:type I restriction-modification system DNA methylase subunit